MYLSVVLSLLLSTVYVSFCVPQPDFSQCITGTNVAPHTTVYCCESGAFTVQHGAVISWSATFPASCQEANHINNPIDDSRFSISLLVIVCAVVSSVCTCLVVCTVYLCVTYCRKEERTLPQATVTLDTGYEGDWSYDALSDPGHTGPCTSTRTADVGDVTGKIDTPPLINMSTL